MLYLKGKWSFRDLRDFFNAHTGRVYESYLGLNEFAEYLGNKILGDQKFEIQVRFSLIRIYTREFCLDFDIHGQGKALIQNKLCVRDQDKITHITGSAIEHLIKGIK